MRIAVLIIALCMTMLVGVQSCTIFVVAGLGSDKQMSGAGSVGVVVAFLYVLGAAFVLKLPKMAGGILAIAGMLGLLAGFRTAFVDLRYWGGLAVVMSLMAFAGARQSPSQNGASSHRNSERT